MTSSFHRGHIVIQSEDDASVWYYEDGTKVSDDPERACGLCKLPNTPEGHDACLGTLPGVQNACCGHGNSISAYIQYWNGVCIRGDDAILEQACLKNERELADGVMRLRCAGEKVAQITERLRNTNEAIKKILDGDQG